MNENFLIKELKDIKNNNTAFQDRMNVMKEGWSNELKKGNGNQMIKEIKKMEKPNKIGKLKLFFNKLINAI